MSATRKSDSLHLVFGDGTSSDLPYIWLRDNCQCAQCFSEGALGRKLLMQDLDLDVKPALISVSLINQLMLIIYLSNMEMINK